MKPTDTPLIGLLMYDILLNNSVDNINLSIVINKPSTDVNQARATAANQCTGYCLPPSSSDLLPGAALNCPLAWHTLTHSLAWHTLTHHHSPPIQQQFTTH
jgi:hypothetical protein